MGHFTFGRNSGLRVSALALGAGNFGTRWGYGADADVARAMLDRFADAGGTFVDTAASYQFGESEEILGRLLAGRRDAFTVATKFAIGGTPDGGGVLQTGNGRRAMFRSVEASLRRLDTDYVCLSVPRAVVMCEGFDPSVPFRCGVLLLGLVARVRSTRAWRRRA
jgi:aryl-alcohol dehydrogenase-like predicted oxidoreductase